MTTTTTTCQPTSTVVETDDTYHWNNPCLPLGEDQWGIGSGVILPSSESNFFDFRQAHHYNNGSGINVYFPHPSDGKFSDEYWAASGLIKTDGEVPAENPDLNHWKTYGVLTGASAAGHTGVFYYNGFEGKFNKHGTVPPTTDFNVFNPYVHHYDLDTGGPIFIPYVSDYIVSTAYVPYSAVIYA